MRAVCVGQLALAVLTVAAAPPEPQRTSSNRAVGAQLERLDASAEAFDRALASHQSNLSADGLALCRAAQLRLRGFSALAQAVGRGALSTGQVLEAGPAAQLLSTLEAATRAASGLRVALESGSQAELREAAVHFEQTRLSAQASLGLHARALLQPARAQLTREDDAWVGRLSEPSRTGLLRLAGGAALAAGAVAFGIGLARRRRATALQALLVGAAGAALLAFAQPVGRLGQPELRIPAGEAACTQMLDISERMKALERPAPRASDDPAALAAAAAWLTAELRAGDAPRAKPKSEALATARAALQSSQECLVYGASGQLGELASAVFDRALGLATGQGFCRTASDCAAFGKACAASVGVCLAWGVYCDNDSDCVAPAACTLEHRCAVGGGSGPSPGEAIGRSKND